MTIRVGGFIFTGLLEDFQATREEASWPITVQTFCLQVAAPLATILTSFIPHRVALRILAFISSFGICCSFFCRDVFWLTIFFGVIHGSALSGVMTCGNVIMAGHFDKKRTTAQGFTSTISAVTMFFVPKLYDMLSKEYRTRGSLLIIGAISLHGFALSITVSELKKRIIAAPTLETKEAVTVRKPCVNPRELRRRCSSIASAVDDFSGSVQCNSSIQERLIEETDVELASFPEPPTTKTNESFRSKMRPLLSFKFFFDVLSFSVILQSLTTFLLLAVDFAKDKGFEPSMAIHTFSAYCAGDLLMRATAGILVDTEVISINALMAVGFITQGIGMVMYAYLENIVWLLIASFIMGASNGARIILFAVILTVDFGLENLIYAFSFGNFINGFSGLARPPLVGFFRDEMDDYSGLFVVIASVNVIAGLAWSARWIMAKCTAATARESSQSQNKN